MIESSEEKCTLAPKSRVFQKTTFLGKLVNRDKSKNRSSRVKASRFAQGVVRSKKSAEKDETRYGGETLPW